MMPWKRRRCSSTAEPIGERSRLARGAEVFAPGEIRRADMASEDQKSWASRRFRHSARGVQNWGRQVQKSGRPGSDIRAGWFRHLGRLVHFLGRGAQFSSLRQIYNSLESRRNRI